MSAYICVFVCVAFFFIALKIEKSILNPASVLSLEWAVVVLLSVLQLYGLNHTESDIYILIFGGVIAFNIGYILVRFKKNRKNIALSIGKRKPYDSNYIWIPKYRLLIVIGVLCAVFSAASLPTTVRYLMSGNDLAALQSMVRSGDISVSSSGTISNAISILFVKPLINCILIIAGVDFWAGNRNKKLLSVAVVLAIEGLLTSGGRAGLFYFIISFICSFYFAILQKKGKGYFRNTSRNFKKKNKRKFIALILVIIIVMGFIFSSRRGEDHASIFQLLYYYFAMPPYMLQEWIKTVNESEILGFGEASLNGFIFPLLYIIKNILGLAYPEHWNQVYSMMQMSDSVWVYIAGLRNANAYVSMFWFFYLDARYVGVMLGSFLYGAFLSGSYRNLKHHKDERNMSIYVLLLIGVLYSFVRFQFSAMVFTLAWLYMLMFLFQRSQVYE